MTPRIEAQFDELEVYRARLLGQLEGLDYDQLNQAPEERAWSVAQVIGHLVLAESLSLGYMTKKIQEPSKLQPRSWLHTLKSRMLTLALRSPFRFTSPPAASQPPADLDLATLRRQWDEVRAALREFVAGCPPEFVDRAIYRHPYAGPMTLERCLCFIDEHIKHHHKQIDRIVEVVA